MMHSETTAHETYPDTHHDSYSKTIFGFWIYLLTDFILFATFFATYAVLQKATYGGPSGRELFNLSFTFVQTLVLLMSSFTLGLAGATAHRKQKERTLLLCVATFVLGLVFLGMQIFEFTHLVSEGNSWQRSAFLSAFFTVVGTHSLHMVFALLWVVVLLIPIFREGLNFVNIRRLTCLRMFWQFLNVIWVFIFTIIYCIGGKAV